MKHLIVILSLMAVSVSAGCSKPHCDATLQKMADSDICDDDVNAAIVHQKIVSQNVLNNLEDRLTCAKLKGDMLKAGDSQRTIKHTLAEHGFNLDCSQREVK
jgi:hypothetical protein